MLRIRTVQTLNPDGCESGRLEYGRRIDGGEIESGESETSRRSPLGTEEDSGRRPLILQAQSGIGLEEGNQGSVSSSITENIVSETEKLEDLQQSKTRPAESSNHHLRHQARILPPGNGFRSEPEGGLGKLPTIASPLGRFVTGGSGREESPAGSLRHSIPEEIAALSQVDMVGKREGGSQEASASSRLSVSSYNKLPYVAKGHSAEKNCTSEPSDLQRVLPSHPLHSPGSFKDVVPISERSTSLAAFYKSLSQRAVAHSSLHPERSVEKLSDGDDCQKKGPYSPPFSESERSGRMSVLSSRSSLSNWSGGTGDLISAAALPNGGVDYEKLKRLLHNDRRGFKERLEREKAKRLALEELLIEYGRKKRRRKKKVTAQEDRDTSTSSTLTSAGSSVSSVDTSDLLLELVRHHLKKGRCGSGTPDRSSKSSKKSLETLSEGGEEDNKENYYESTSLFSLLPAEKDMDLPHPPAAPLQSRSYQNTGFKRSQVGDKYVKPPVVQMGPGFEARHDLGPAIVGGKESPTEHLPASSSWWVTEDGKMTNKMPHTLKKLLEMKHPRFLERSLRRQNMIRRVSVYRKELSSRLRMLAEEVASGHLTLPEATEIADRAGLSKKPSAFPLKEMRRRTKQKYLGLPEHQKREMELKRQAESSVNRICALMYKQRISYQVVTKGNANIS